jgi:hypothetical protein
MYIYIASGGQYETHKKYISVHAEQRTRKEGRGAKQSIKEYGQEGGKAQAVAELSGF